MRSLASLPRRARACAVVSAFLVLTLHLAAHAQNAASAPRSVKVRRGQTLSLSLLTRLDSGQSHIGDEVRAKLNRPLVANGAVVLPAESIVHGTVTKVKRAGANCHDGEIKWSLSPVTTVNRATIKLQPVYSYPYDPKQTGEPAWVPLNTPLKTIGRIPAYVGLTVFVVALSPLLIPMGLAATEPCRGRAGQEQVLPAGRDLLYAVSKDVRVTSPQRLSKPRPR